MREIYLLLVLLSKLTLTLVSAQDLFFDEHQFRIRVSNALKSMEAILEDTRKPALLGTVDDHTYQDKYALVEFVANSGIASHINALKFIGIDNDIITKAMNWVHNLNQTVSLEFNGSMYDEFVEKVERAEVWDYHYNLCLNFTLTIRSGDEQIHLMDVSDFIPIVGTLEKEEEYQYYIDLMADGMAPNRWMYLRILGDYNEYYTTVRLKTDLNLTWLLRMISENESQFAINRYHESCRTPSRNNDVKKLLESNAGILQFTRQVSYFIKKAHRVHQGFDEQAATKFKSSPQVNIDDIYIPIVPVFENSTILSTDDLDRLLKQQVRTLDATTSIAIGKYKDHKFTTHKSVVLQLISDHIISLSEQLVASIGYVEKMLETQLIEAIGKRINSNDFEKFMKHHNKKFFNDEFVPVLFSRAVQTPGRYPDGVISIESLDVDDSEPVETLVREIPANSNRGMVIPIDAATKVELQGDQYLHGWIQHVWQNNRGKSHNLVARAHQFSSYLLIIGVFGSGTTFIPKEALILKNKDEVIIPLLSEILPSAKEFKNAIASLSPEQQEFAKAYRAMQLESSVFGICLIPLKPQMEILLNLPEGALTKEIQLMQDLMYLFEYQIPSDLLSFDGPEDTAGSYRVETVKGHVSAVLEVIEGEKQKQLTEAKERAKMAQNVHQAREHSPGLTVRQDRIHDLEYLDYSTSEIMLLDIEGMNIVEMDIGKMFSASVTESSVPSIEPSSIPSCEPMQTNTKQKVNSEAIHTKNIPRQKGNSEPVKTQPNEDFTLIPKLLDARLDEQSESALKSTIIKTGENWERLRKENLLLPAQRSSLKDLKKSEKNKAMDLLNAMSRSGSLPILQSDLHIIISVSHCFHNNLLSTVIQDNINPIEQVEKSLLMIGSVIHGVEPPRLLS